MELNRDLPIGSIIPWMGGDSTIPDGWEKYRGLEEWIIKTREEAPPTLGISVSDKVGSKEKVG